MTWHYIRGFTVGTLSLNFDPEFKTENFGFLIFQLRADFELKKKTKLVYQCELEIEHFEINSALISTSSFIF
jgi:hypothetical protein